MHGWGWVIDNLDIRASLHNQAVRADEPTERYLVITLDGQASAAAADRPMNVAVVMDNDRLIGIVSKIDLIEHLTASHR